MGKKKERVWCSHTESKDRRDLYPSGNGVLVDDSAVNIRPELGRFPIRNIDVVNCAESLFENGIGRICLLEIASRLGLEAWFLYRG